MGILLSVWVFLAVSFIQKTDSPSPKQLTVVLRAIGHELLWHAHDSTSRILPIRQLDKTTYQIRFENAFEFVPDTLISIVDRHFRKTFSTLPSYVVTVLNCETKEIVLAYEVSTKNGNTLPCIGRVQPMGCYIVEVSFLEKTESDWSVYIMVLIPILLIGVLFFNKIPKPKTNEPLTAEPCIGIGTLNFYYNKKLLETNSNTRIVLSEKENKILKIFAENQNQIIERDRLMKEVWEDDGVIVISRNLDVFVSKLRKKLHSDTTIKLVNIHGKGYKLEVESI